MKELTVEQARYVANYMHEYYDKFSRIDEYMRDHKMEVINSMPVSLPGMGHEEDFFSDYSMHPSEMQFDVIPCKQEKWNSMLQLVASHAHMQSVPGKSLHLLVKERNTKKVVGFLSIGSPVINCRPRNEMLGGVPDLKSFNQTTVMGFIIIPVQPFGYNYLGGKLLAGICCSHEIRRMINKKYGTNIVMFETTSLYGNSKSMSQYDGMKPFMRNKGITDSNFVPMMHGDRYRNLLKYVENAIDGEVVPKGVSSRKMKATNAIIGMVKRTLDGADKRSFQLMIERAKSLTEQKRYYVSNYGVKNYIDIVNGKTNKIVKEVNFDRYELPQIVEWWKKKASRRFETLQMDSRVRNDLEIWTEDTNIDIIR